MICPKCNKGELQEHDFSPYIGVCDNLDCGALFNESGEEMDNPYIIYQKDKTKVYVCECVREKCKKLTRWTIRRDDNTGFGHLLGIISFNGRWRQYTTKFEPNTEWSSGCKRKICDFEDILNVRWHASIRRKRK